jgi:hypothetical protein
MFYHPYLLGEARLHDDLDVKKMLNRVLRKKINTSIAYAISLRDFANFVES